MLQRKKATKQAGNNISLLLAMWWGELQKVIFSNLVHCTSGYFIFSSPPPKLSGILGKQKKKEKKKKRKKKKKRYNMKIAKINGKYGW